MKLALIGLAIVHVVAFSYMMFSRLRSRGTIALHRWEGNVRRRRSDPVEITNTMEILRADYYGKVKN